MEVLKLRQQRLVTYAKLFRRRDSAAAGWELIDVKEEEAGSDRARYYLKRAK